MQRSLGVQKQFFNEKNEKIIPFSNCKRYERSSNFLNFKIRKKYAAKFLTINFFRKLKVLY